MTKTIYIRIIKVVSVVLISLTSLIIISSLFSTKQETFALTKRTKKTAQVFNEPENTIDVLLLGHSGVYSAYSPMEAYEEYGFTSYSVSQPIQKPFESYNYLVELLKVQKPKVIVYDVDHLFYDNLVGVADSALNSIKNNILPIFSNHIMWKHKLDKKSIDLKERDITKGYRVHYGVKEYKGSGKLNKTNEVYKIKKNQYSYLLKIYELSKKYDIPFLLIEIPSKTRWDYKKYNAVKKFAEKKELEFIDFNQRLDEFSFSWKNDTRDKGDHLNHFGALKFTKYIGSILKNKYDLECRKDNPDYNHWKEDLVSYKKLIKEQQNVNKK